MPTIEEMFPNCRNPEYSWFSPPDYSELISSFGHEILLEEEDGHYQGDTRVLLRREDEAYGFLMFGWGSCSGCDALQACSNYKDLEELRDYLIQSIQWQDSLESMRKFIENKDWAGEFQPKAAQEFAKKALAELDNRTP